MDVCEKVAQHTVHTQFSKCFDSKMKFRMTRDSSLHYLLHLAMLEYKHCRFQKLSYTFLSLLDSKEISTFGNETSLANRCSSTKINPEGNRQTDVVTSEQMNQVMHWYCFKPLRSFTADAAYALGQRSNPGNHNLISRF